MRDNSFDRTVERNYIQRWRFLIREYEAVKEGRSAHFTRIGDFYRHHGTCSQTFRKYYNRFLQSGRSEAELIPQRRGPRWKTRRMAAEVEDIVLQERARGLNRYEIHAILCQRVAPAPSVSAIYRAMVRHGVNRRPKAVEEKRRIIKTAIGELGHADLHRLSRDIFLDPPAQEVHVLSVIDACSRLAWAGLVTGKKALPVMFRALAVITHPAPALRCAVRRTHHRQRRRIRQPKSAPGASVRTHAQRTRHQAPLHAALPPTDQRKGRALLENPRRRPRRSNHLRQP